MHLKNLLALELALALGRRRDLGGLGQHALALLRLGELGAPCELEPLRLGPIGGGQALVAPRRGVALRGGELHLRQMVARKPPRDRIDVE